MGSKGRTPLFKDNDHPKNTDPKSAKKKVHLWRVCPVGEHWVRTHSMKVPPSKTHPEGYITTRRAHCALNPSGKDRFYPDEILEISKSKEFLAAKKKPCPLEFEFGEVGSKYDTLIAGWVQYWNEVFQPQEPLDPNGVKALIASESSFDKNNLANRKNKNSARGLMQVTNESRRILGDEKGEIRDHFISVTREDLNNPSINICAGIRWLFHKKKLMMSKSKPEPTWEEVIRKYKGTQKATKERGDEIIKIYKWYFEELRKCGKK